MENSFYCFVLAFRTSILFLSPINNKKVRNDLNLLLSYRSRICTEILSESLHNVTF